LGRAFVTRLIWAEATRLLSRRLTGMAMIALLLGLAGYQLVVNDVLSPPTGEELAAAERTYQQVHQDWLTSHEQWERECRDTGAPPAECVIPEPVLAEFTGDATPFKETASAALKLSTLLLALVTFTVAASFIGAEYSSGSITSWLTFVPRRGQVFWAKLLTVAGFAALLGTLGAALVFGTALTLAHLHGSGVESFPELAGVGARSVLACHSASAPRLLHRSSDSPHGWGYRGLARDPPHLVCPKRCPQLPSMGTAHHPVDARRQSCGNR
jgi:ABC-2 type transport system permease protein